MKLQEMFDKSVNGVLKQGGPCIVDEQCVYRGDGSQKCVVGQLIKKNHYNKYEMEGRGISPDNAVGRAVVASIGKLPSRGYPMLIALQIAHDDHNEGSSYLESFFEDVEKIAVMYKLNMDGIKFELVEE